MIPCYSLFLEIEVPDPALNYFIIGQNELDNTEKLLAPPPLGVPTQATTPCCSDEVEETGMDFSHLIDCKKASPLKNYDYDLANWPTPPAESSGIGIWNGEDGRSNCTIDHPDGSTRAGFLIQADGEVFHYDEETESWLFTIVYALDYYTRYFNYSWDCDGTWNSGDDKRECGAITFSNYDANGDILGEKSWMEQDFIYKAYNEPHDRIEKGAHVTTSFEHPTLSWSEFPFNARSGWDWLFPEILGLPTPPDDCSGSGLNTFVLGASCLDGDIDLLEGWGAAQPNYKWVDVITDSTDITLDRGFDIQQGIVGTPIAGVMTANVQDPFLDGIETQKVAVGQRVRLRAGTDIVFSGVCNSVRSDYDAVNVPNLRIEAVDALGLLNAQMVSARPQEAYNTRIAEAASKVELPILQQESTTILNPTEDAMSALDLLIETQDSEGSVVWLDRFGTLYSTNRYWLEMTELPVFRNSRFDKPVKFTFTNNPGNPDFEIGIGATTQDVCLSAYRQVADTSQVINGITFYNYVEEEQEGRDEEGNPIMEKVIVRDTHTFESANSRRLYGDAGVRLTTYLPPTDLVGYADYVFANYDTPKTKVETIQFPLDKWKSIDVPEMVTIDIGDPVNVRIDDPLTSHTLNNATQRVARIRHIITPQEWLCEMDLL
jgi:hypothetical protein